MSVKRKIISQFNFLTVVATGLLFVVCISNAEIAALNDQLNRMMQEKSDHKAKLETEKLSVADQVLKLNQRAIEIEEELQKIQTDVSLDFRLVDLKDLMIKPLGQCEVITDSSPFTYFIKKGDVQIRFSFQDVVGESIGKISRKNVGLPETPVLEITLEPQYPPGHEATRTSAVIRLNPETMQVVHATFTGFKVNDKLMGYASSKSLHQLVCEL